MRGRLAAVTGAAAVLLSGCLVHPSVDRERAAVVAATGSLAAQPAMACDSLARLVAATARLAPAAEDLVRASLHRHEGTVVRWPDGVAVHVWVQPYRSAVAHQGGAVEFMQVVHHAIRDWDRARAGVRLILGRDSASAEVRILWTARLAPLDSASTRTVDGRSAVERNATSGAVEVADVYLGERDRNGTLRTSADVHAIAVHEIGHVLGLSHGRMSDAAPRASVMAARVVAHEVTADDHHALRAWYALPVGLRCAEGSLR